MRRTEDGNGTELERYRVKDQHELIERLGRIEHAEDWLVRRTLERIETEVEGIKVRWLAGKEIWSQHHLMHRLYVIIL